MRLEVDRKDIVNNFIAGAILVHYASIIASLVFLSKSSWVGAGFNLILFIIWFIIAIKVSKKHGKS